MNTRSSSRRAVGAGLLLVAWLVVGLIPPVPAADSPAPGAPRALAPVLRQSALAPLMERADRESLVLRLSAKQAPQRVLDRAAFATLQLEPVAGQRVPAAALFDRATASHRVLAADLARIPAAALAAKAETLEAAVEFEDRVVLVRTVRLVVRDSVQAAANSPEFAGMLANVDRARLARATVADLTPAQRAGFRRFMATEFPTLPADDPLKQAFARGGEDAVLRAELGGEGELEVTEEIEVLRAPVADWRKVLPAGYADGLARPAEGAAPARAPVHEGPGRGKAGAAAAAKPPAGVGSRPANPAAFDPATHVFKYPAGEQAGGEHVFEAPFLAGFTLGSGCAWERRWKFGRLGWLRLSFSYGLGLGLRIPLAVDGRLQPALIERSAPDCPARELELRLQARAFDAPAAYYRERGVPEAQVFEGRELVLMAGTRFGYKLVAFGETVTSGSLEGPGVDRGADFAPPLSERRDLCTVWIPPEATNSQVNYGVLTAFVELGVGLQGRGTVRTRVRPWIDGRSGEAFAPALGSAPYGGTVTLPALAPRSPGSVQGQPYGFELALVGYHLDLNAVVKITAGATVTVSDFKRTVRLPALDLMTLDLPDFALGPHAGTPDSHAWREGLRAFEHRPESAVPMKPKRMKPAKPVKPAK